MSQLITEYVAVETKGESRDFQSCPKGEQVRFLSATPIWEAHVDVKPSTAATTLHPDQKKQRKIKMKNTIVEKIELKVIDVATIHEELYGFQCSVPFAKNVIHRYNLLKKYDNTYSIYSFLRKNGPEIVVEYDCQEDGCQEDDCQEDHDGIYAF